MKYAPLWECLNSLSSIEALDYRLEGIRHAVAFVPVTDVAWCFIAQFDGMVPYHNNLYFLHVTGAPTHDEVQELADAMFGWHKNDIMPLLASDTKLTAVTCQMLDSLVGDFAVSFEGAGIAGGTSGTHAPLNCGARLDFLTADPTPAGRGNNTISGIPISVVTKERIDATWYALLQERYELVNERLPLNWQWVIVSRRFLGTERSAGVTNPVTAVHRHDNIVVSRRSRLLKSVH